MAKYVHPSVQFIKLLCAHTSTDETRYHLTGIYFDHAGPTSRLVATDGHRLLSLDCALSLIPNTDFNPSTIYETEAFKVGALKAMEGKYPNWRQLLPQEGTAIYKFKLTIPDWFSGVKKGRGSPIPTIGLDSNGQWTTGKALTYLNIMYLATYAGVECTIEIKDALSPIVIKPCDCPDNWTAVVMPMRGDARGVSIERMPQAKAIELVKEMDA